MQRVRRILIVHQHATSHRKKLAAGLTDEFFRSKVFAGAKSAEELN